MYSDKVVRRILQLPPALRRPLHTTAPRSTPPEIYDVVCLGGGPAGLALLSALRDQPTAQSLKIALIDSQDLSTLRKDDSAESYSNRCSSLTPSSRRFLRNIGAWDHVASRRVQPYHGMEVWDGVSGSKVSFDALERKGGFGGGLLDAVAQLVPGSRFTDSERKYEIEADDDEGAIATMCENQNLTSALLQRMEEIGGVEMLDKTKVESIQLGALPEDETFPDLSQWPVITLSDSRRLAARLLVGADGANSPVRNFANIPGHGWDYGQHGVVATLHLEQSDTAHGARVAYQRFLPTGPIALLPLPGNKASLVWSITTPLATKLKNLSSQQLAGMIDAAFRLETTDLLYLLNHASEVDIADELSWRLPNTSDSSTGLPQHFPHISKVQEGSIASFPLRMRHASTYTGHRVALIGDAAHTIHPLAGQGLNLGLADADALARRLVDGLRHGMDVGSCWCLDGYNSERWTANNAVIGVCDKLQKLYSADSGPVVWGRSLGLQLVDRLGPVKGMLMGAAGGMR